MEEQQEIDPDALAYKIAHLVKERGWNQEDFARSARLNRHTVREIMREGTTRRLRNATVSECAKALNLSVNELRTLPLERLLQRMGKQAEEIRSQTDSLRQLYDKATQPDLLAWLDRNPDRARQLSASEVEEVLSLQGPEGPLTAFGVDTFIQRLERRRQLLQQVHTIAGTEYLDLLEQMVGLLYDKVRPNRDRT